MNNSDITYEKFNKNYADGVFALQNEWFYENITFGFIADTIETLLTYQNDYFYVALDGSNVIGYATAERIDDCEYNIFPKGASYLRVNDLYVAKDYRSNGIGERLLSIIEHKANENGLRHILLSSSTKDADAVRNFYTRNGYGIWTTMFYKRTEWDVRTYPLNELDGYRFGVIFARYKNKWLYCRHKERSVYETAGGHIEKGESALDAAKRELYEETGALKYTIRPIFDYSVHNSNPKDFSNGQVYLAEISELGDIPDYEMAEVKLFDAMPDKDKMRFPQILPVLFEKVTAIIDIDNDE